MAWRHRSHPNRCRQWLLNASYQCLNCHSGESGAVHSPCPPTCRRRRGSTPNPAGRCCGPSNGVARARGARRQAHRATQRHAPAGCCRSADSTALRRRRCCRPPDTSGDLSNSAAAPTSRRTLGSTAREADRDPRRSLRPALRDHMCARSARQWDSRRRRSAGVRLLRLLADPMARLRTDLWAAARRLSWPVSETTSPRAGCRA